MAELAMTIDPPLVEPAAYHCQQAAEKLFKGLLVAAARTVPRTLDLEYLADLRAGRFSDLDSQIQALAILTPWAVETRYPQIESDAGLTGEDVQQAIVQLTILRDSVLRLATRILPRPTAGDP